MVTLLKMAMLTSVLDIVDLESNMSGDEMRVGGFDLIYKANCFVGPINNLTSQYTTTLGCEVPAEPTLRRAASKAVRRQGEDEKKPTKENPRGGKEEKQEGSAPRASDAGKKRTEDSKPSRR